jgi:hypothetical protein
MAMDFGPESPLWPLLLGASGGALGAGPGQSQLGGAFQGAMGGMQMAQQMATARDAGALRKLQAAQAQDQLERRKKWDAFVAGGGIPGFNPVAPGPGAPQMASADPTATAGALTPMPGERPGPTPSAASRLPVAASGQAPAGGGLPPQLAMMFGFMEPEQAQRAIFDLYANSGTWQPIKDDGGRTIGNRNLRTGEEKYRPANVLDRWVPETRGGAPGQVNERTGEWKALDPSLAKVSVQPNINLPPVESEFQKSYGGEMGKAAAKIHDAADNSRTQIQRLQLLDGLLSDVETGKLAPFRSNLGAWAQDLGISPDVLARFGIKPTDPVNSQGITAITNALTVGMIGPGGFPANNFSDADRKFLQETMPQLSNTPGGNRIISQAMRRAAERNIAKEEMWLAANEAGKTYPAFLREWNGYVKATPLFPKVMSAEQMAQLPSGTVFTAPDGSVRVRP